MGTTVSKQGFFIKVSYKKLYTFPYKTGTLKRKPSVMSNWCDTATSFFRWRQEEVLCYVFWCYVPLSLSPYLPKVVPGLVTSSVQVA